MQTIKTLFNLRWLTLIVALTLFLGIEKSAAESVLYGAAHTTTGESVLYRIDPSTGEATEVGPIGFQGCSGMDFNPSWALYATCTRADGTHVLVTIDQESGSGTEVGPTGIQLLGPELILGTDISFRSDGTLFAYIIGIPDYLGTIDLPSGLASPIGNLHFLEWGNGLAFSPDDKLFHAGSISLAFAGGKLRILAQEPNVAGNIESEPVANLKFPSQTPALINALEFEPRTGILFASVNYGGSESFLAIVNTQNGHVTVMGQTQDSLDAMAFVPVPEVTDVPNTSLGGAPYLKCNKISKASYLKIEVMLETSSESKMVRVMKPESLCTVLYYDEGGVLTESTTTLTCYKVEDVPRQRKSGHRHVDVTNEFEEQTFSVGALKTLCVPTEVTGDRVHIETEER